MGNGTLPDSGRLLRGAAPALAGCRLARRGGGAACLAVGVRWLLAPFLFGEGARFFASDALGLVLYFPLVVGLGLILGRGIADRWPYGRIVAVLTVACFAVVLANNLLLWQTWKAGSDAAFNSIAELIRQWADRAGENGNAEEKAFWLRKLEVVPQFRDNRFALVFGCLFAGLLCASCVAVSFTTVCVRRWLGEPGPIGSFQAMRPPEWLVWAAIGCVGLWFADWKWSVGVFRTVSWNASIGLGAIYWLNGLGLFLYGVNILQPHLFVFVALVLILANAGALPVLAFLGLFDTWIDFRQRFNRLAQARRQREEDDNQEP